MEVRYNIRRVDVPMNDPGVVANVVAPPLDQVFQAVPAHAQIQSGLYFVLFLAFYKNWWRRGSHATANYRVGSGQSELDNGKDRVQSGKLGGSFKRYAPWPTQVSMGYGPRRRWASFVDGRSVAISVASTHTKSPGCSTGAGSRRRL